jgi:SDR family mycofactocin-dependent oxidoreductase
VTVGGRLDGKVVYITGVARGQGRAHAVHMAREGADVVGVDICAPVPPCTYEAATPDDLSETQRLVVAEGRRFVGRIADVREKSQLQAAVDAGLEALGHLDVVVAQAAVCPMAPSDDPMDFIAAFDVDLCGVVNTIAVTLPHLAEGASIIITGSVGALAEGSAQGLPGGGGYTLAKRTLGMFTQRFSTILGPKMIRINCIHPTNVNTQMLHNDAMYQVFCPDIDQPTREQAEARMAAVHSMPRGWIEPEDVANLAVFLAADESRFVSGQQIFVDLGGARFG